MAMLTPELLPLLAALLVSGSCLLAARCVYRLTIHPLARFPGPKAAALSSLFAMSYDIPTSTSYIKEFPAWHDKYGPIIRTEPNHLHIRDLDSYNQVFRQGSRWSKDPALYSFPFSKGSIVNELRAKEGRAHRDMYKSFFSRSSIIQLEGVIKENLGTFLARIGELSIKEEIIDLNLAFRCLTADTILKYVFNTSFGALSVPGFRYDMVAAMEKFMSDPSFTAAWYMPNLMETLITWIRKFPKLGRRLNPGFGVALDQLEFCEKRVLELRAAEQEIKGPCVFLNALKPNTAKGHPVLNDKELGADAWILYFAGTDTSATTLIFGTWHLLTNPQYLRMLQAELKQAIPHSDDLSVMELGWADLEKLDILRGVVKESLRLSYGIPGKLSRIVPPGGATLCGQFIPGGTVVSMSCYSYHHSAKYFATHPHSEFRPERWLSQEDNELNDKAFMPFSRGARDCIGRNLGLATLYLAFAYVFRRYEFEVFETTSQDMEWHDGFLPVAFGHLKVKARRMQD